MTQEPQVLDRSSLKVNQIGIISLSLLGFILNQPFFPAFVAAVMLAGRLDPRLALFKQAYARVVKPLGLMNPQPVEDIQAPHEFAQLLGGLFLLAGSILLYAGSPLTGWSLTWVVILLAAMNLFFGFCAGCFVYYQLRKLGIPGFTPRQEGPNELRA
jgi:hypothetical protein